MAIDVERARADTPGCENVVHLNNAGASLTPSVVVDTVVDYLRREAEMGGYELAERSTDAIDAVYASIARLVGASPDEIAMFDGATRAWDVAFASIPFAPGDRILMSRAEYASSVMAFLQLARRTDVSVEVVPDDEHGQLDVGALRELLDERVRLVAVTHVPTSSGLVNPAAAVGEAIRGSRALYLLDACQSAGQMPLDMDAIGCHFLSATGRKFLRAPRGTGFLYVRRDVAERTEPVFVDLRSATWVAPDRYELVPDARRFETWERNIATMLGLGSAVDYALAWGLDEISARVGAIAQGLRDRLIMIDGVTIRDLGERRCGIVTFTVDGVETEMLADSLRAEGINVWTSHITSSRIDFEARGLESVVRASPHYYNTDAELDRLADAVAARV